MKKFLFFVICVLLMVSGLSAQNSLPHWKGTTGPTKDQILSFYSTGAGGSNWNIGYLAEREAAKQVLLGNPDFGFSGSVSETDLNDKLNSMQPRKLTASHLAEFENSGIVFGSVGFEEGKWAGDVWVWVVPGKNGNEIPFMKGPCANLLRKKVSAPPAPAQPAQAYVSPVQQQAPIQPQGCAGCTTVVYVVGQPATQQFVPQQTYFLPGGMAGSGGIQYFPANYGYAQPYGGYGYGSLGLNLLNGLTIMTNNGNSGGGLWGGYGWQPRPTNGGSWGGINPTPPPPPSPTPWRR